MGVINHLHILGKSDQVQQKIVANATQTNDMFQILASDGTTPYFKVLGTGSIQATVGYKSSDGTDGLTATKVFNDGAVVNTVTIKNGLITSWTQV